MIRNSCIFFILAAFSLLLAGCTSPTPTPQPAVIQPPDLLASGGRTLQAQQFLDLMVQEDFTAAFEQFDPQMKAALPENKLQDTWAKLLSQVGPFEQVISAKTETVDGYERITLTSQFQNAALDVRVVYGETGEVSGLFFAPAAASAVPWEAPAYARQEAFEDVEVIIGSGEWALPGTLSLPEGDGPFPAIVLVHGSGPNDRDETVGPNKPFRDLAWGLASQGIAVLRYDKRTLAHADKLESSLDHLTVQAETVEDALLAVALLRDTEKVDRERIFVLGHSLGGMLVPRIGAGDAEITGFIILAGGTRPLEDVILEQMTYIASLDSPPDEAEQEQLDQVLDQVERIKDPGLSTDTPAGDLLGVPASYWLDLRGYDPPEQARLLERPTLVLQGERDYQVTEVDFDRWQQALGGKAWAEFKRYPRLNHLFIAGEGQITPAEYQLPGNVAEEVVTDIAAWINR